MSKLIANSGDPDQTLCSAASDLGLHCLPITLLGVSRLQWVKILSGMAYTFDQDQKQSYLGLPCLCMPFCQKLKILVHLPLFSCLLILL